MPVPPIVKTSDPRRAEKHLAKHATLFIEGITTAGFYRTIAESVSPAQAVKIATDSLWSFRPGTQERQYSSVIVHTAKSVRHENLVAQCQRSKQPLRVDWELE